MGNISQNAMHWRWHGLIAIIITGLHLLNSILSMQHTAVMLLLYTVWTIYHCAYYAVSSTQLFYSEHRPCLGKWHAKTILKPSNKASQLQRPSTTSHSLSLSWQTFLASHRRSNLFPLWWSSICHAGSAASPNLFFILVRHRPFDWLCSRMPSAEHFL